MIVKHLKESKEVSARRNEQMPSIIDSRYVIAPDGRLLDMNRIKKMIRIAINQVDESIDTTLQQFFNRLPISYTFKIPTMATNGKNILINPGFAQHQLDVFGGRNPIGIAFVLLHELLHVVFDHTSDIYNKNYPDHKRANNAQDYEINYMIENSTFDANTETGGLDYIFKGVTKKLDGLINPDYAGMVWMEIYDILKNSNRETPDSEEMSEDMKRGIMDGINEALGGMGGGDDSDSSQNDEDSENDSGNGDGEEDGDEYGGGAGGSDESGDSGNGDGYGDDSDGSDEGGDSGNGNGDEYGADGSGEGGLGGRQMPSKGPVSNGGMPSGRGSADYERGKEIGRELAKQIGTDSVTVSDGEYTGNDDITCGEHVITDDEMNNILDSIGAEPNSTPISTDDLISSIEKIFNRPSMDRSGKGIEHMGKLIQKIKHMRSGFKNWKSVLRGFLTDRKIQPDGINKKKLAVFDIPSDRKSLLSGFARRLVVCVDTSGSVCGTPDLLRQICTEISNIARTCNLDTIDLIQFDDGPYAGADGNIIQELHPRSMPSNWSMSNVSGGGTEFLPMYELLYNTYVKGHKRYNAILIISDSDIINSMNSVSDFKKKYGVAPFEGRKGLYLIFDNVYSQNKDRIKASIQHSSKLMVIPRDEFLRQISKNSVNEAFTEVDDDDEYNEPVRDLHIVTDEERDKALISAKKIAGTFADYASDIINWMKRYYTNLKYVSGTFELTQKENTYLIDDSMRVVVNCKRFNAGNLQFAPEYIRINNVIGDVYLTSSMIKSFTEAFPLMCTNNVHISNCSQLTSLNRCPVPMGKRIFVTGATKINKAEETNKYKNENIKIITESMKNIDVFNEIVSKRVRLGKLHESYLGEAFGERGSNNVLSKVMTNPENRKIFDTYLAGLLPWSQLSPKIVKDWDKGDIKTFEKKVFKSDTDNVGLAILTDDNYKITACMNGRKIGRDIASSWTFAYLDEKIDDYVSTRIDATREFKTSLESFGLDPKGIIKGARENAKKSVTLKTPTLQAFLGSYLYDYIAGYDTFKNLFDSNKTDIFDELIDEAEAKGLNTDSYNDEAINFGYGKFNYNLNGSEMLAGKKHIADENDKNFLMTVSPEDNDGTPDKSMYLSIAQFFDIDFLKMIIKAALCDDIADDVDNKKKDANYTREYDISSMSNAEIINLFNDIADINLRKTIMGGLSSLSNDADTGTDQRHKLITHTRLKDLTNKNDYEIFDAFIYLFPDYCSHIISIAGEKSDSDAVLGDYADIDNGILLSKNYIKKKLNKNKISSIKDVYGIDCDMLPEMLSITEYNQYIEKYNKEAMEKIYTYAESRRPRTNREIEDIDKYQLFSRRKRQSDIDDINLNLRAGSGRKYMDAIRAARQRIKSDDSNDIERRNVFITYLDELRKYKAGIIDIDALNSAKENMRRILNVEMINFSDSNNNLSSVMNRIKGMVAKIKKQDAEMIEGVIEFLEAFSENVKDAYKTDELSGIPDELQSIYEDILENLIAIKKSRPSSDDAKTAIQNIKAIGKELEKKNDDITKIVKYQVKRNKKNLIPNIIEKISDMVKTIKKSPKTTEVDIMSILDAVDALKEMSDNVGPVYRTNDITMIPDEIKSIYRNIINNLNVVIDGKSDSSTRDAVRKANDAIEKIADMEEYIYSKNENLKRFLEIGGNNSITHAM